MILFVQPLDRAPRDGDLVTPHQRLDSGDHYADIGDRSRYDHVIDPKLLHQQVIQARLVPDSVVRLFEDVIVLVRSKAYW